MAMAGSLAWGGAYNGRILPPRPPPARETGGAADIPGRNAMQVSERIQAEIEGHPVVLFMKGTPQFPMCGFSSRTVQALKQAGASGLHTVNVLEEPEIRANLPRYSNWPTFPQLFINGELIGGCDITLELLESGELARMLKEVQLSGSQKA
jgi:monothiol glutaredoxin